MAAPPLAPLRRVFDAMQYGVALVSGDRVLYMNPALGTWLEERTEDLVEGDAERLFHRLRRLDAEETEVTGAGAEEDLFVETELGGGVIAVCVNVERRGSTRLRKRLSVTERLASLGTLAAGISHAVNNPLSAAMAGVETMQRDLARAHDGYAALHEALTALHGVEEADRLLVHVAGLKHLGSVAADTTEAIARISGVMQDVSTFASADNLSISATDINDAVRGAANLARYELRHVADVQMDLRSVPPVATNQGQLAQVFLHLFTNAAHAIESVGDGRGKVEVRSMEHGSNVVVTIRDTGPGVPAELREAVFEPFFTTKPPSMGTGLGLAVCRRIVESHGGSISLESARGPGARVRVSLPKMEGHQADDPGGERHDAQPASRPRVLVVDDDPLVRRGLSRALRASFDARVVGSAMEAMALLEAGLDYDAVLCDVMMGGLSGIEFYRWLERNRADLLPRVVFISGGGATPEARRFMAEHKDRLLAKPFRIEELEACLASLGAGAIPEDEEE